MTGSRLVLPRVLPLTIGVMVVLLSVKAATFAKDAGASASVAVPPVSAPSGSLLSVPAGPAPAAVSGSSPASGPEISDSERGLLQDLRRRREKLDAREQAIEDKENVIKAVQARIQGKLEQLSNLQSKLDKSNAAHQENHDENWGGLVKIYETMKPRDAAAIFNVLDMHVLLEVLDRMNERKAAAVLAAMQPERARMATQMLAHKRLHQDLWDQGPNDGSSNQVNAGK